MNKAETRHDLIDPALEAAGRAHTEKASPQGEAFAAIMPAWVSPSMTGAPCGASSGPMPKQSGVAHAIVTATRYFEEQVLRKRPYVTSAMCRAVIAAPLRRALQEDGRIRHWGLVHLPGEDEARILRVVTLTDGVTLHNAFIDRDFRAED